MQMHRWRLADAQPENNHNAAAFTAHALHILLCSGHPTQHDTRAIEAAGAARLTPPASSTRLLGNAPSPVMHHGASSVEILFSTAFSAILQVNPF